MKKFNDVADATEYVCMMLETAQPDQVWWRDGLREAANEFQIAARGLGVPAGFVSRTKEIDLADLAKEVKVLYQIFDTPCLQSGRQEAVVLAHVAIVGQKLQSIAVSL